MENKTLLFRDKKIHYKVYGNGKPVLLLHGFAEDGNVWQLQADFLQGRFRVIVPDIPGSGQSQFIAGANIDTYAEAIKEIFDAEQLKDVSLIGHSMGGYITLAFAEKYPGYLNGFGLFHSTAFADTDEKKQVRKKAIEFIREKGGYTFLKTSTPGLFTQQYRDEHAEKINALIESAKNFTDEALIQYYEAMMARPDRTHVLKNFNKPVLFIIGGQDTAVPFDSSMKQCHLPSISHVHILRQSAHMGLWEEAGKANRIAEAFLSAL